MYNKTISRFDFCAIQNNQGLGKGYQLVRTDSHTISNLQAEGYLKLLT